MINKYLPLIARGAIVGLILCVVLSLLVTGVFYSTYFGFINVFSGTPFLVLLGVFLLIMTIALIMIIIGIIRIMTECEDFRTTIKNYVTKGEL